jgi:hypothetical protein
VYRQFFRIKCDHDIGHPKKSSTVPGTSYGTYGEDVVLGDTEVMSSLEEDLPSSPCHHARPLRVRGCQETWCWAIRKSCHLLKKIFHLHHVTMHDHSGFVGVKKRVEHLSASMETDGLPQVPLFLFASTDTDDLPDCAVGVSVRTLIRTLLLNQASLSSLEPSVGCVP